MPKELVIIPAFNEELNIKKIIEEINIERPGCDCIVVNDGSTDRTEEIVMEMRINIVSHPVNLGAVAAVQTGLKYADRNKYEIAVVIDGDGQHDPKEVSRIIDAMAENNADVVRLKVFRCKVKYKGVLGSARRYKYLLVYSNSGRKVQNN